MTDRWGRLRRRLVRVKDNWRDRLAGGRERGGPRSDTTFGIGNPMIVRVWIYGRRPSPTVACPQQWALARGNVPVRRENPETSPGILFRVSRLPRRPRE